MDQVRQMAVALRALGRTWRRRGFLAPPKIFLLLSALRLAQGHRPGREGSCRRRIPQASRSLASLSNPRALRLLFSLLASPSLAPVWLRCGPEGYYRAFWKDSAPAHFFLSSGSMRLANDFHPCNFSCNRGIVGRSAQILGLSVTFGGEAHGSARLSKSDVAWSWAAVAVFGAVEGLYGRTQYFGDWISYLNVSRAVRALDWRAIFDPMWSPGYPVLVAFARAFAPSTPEGEWYAITVLNLAIFLGAFAAWRFLVRTAVAFCEPASLDLTNHPLAIWTTTWLFLGCFLGFENVSASTPDLLVAAGFILATALTLRVIQRRILLDATALGLVLGLGAWVKGANNVLAAIILFVLLINCCATRRGWRCLGVSAAVFGVLFAGYVAAISWSYGALTFGASGALNYAFHVNHLPHWTHWQGGPEPLGAPIHPTRRLFPDLPAYEFATPFTTTYPPYNNLAYWYQGFRQIHNPQAQLAAIGRSVHLLARIARNHPIIPGLGLALLISLARREWGRALWGAVTVSWPLFLPSILCLAAYAAVHVEARYIGPFVLVFGLAPLAPLLKRDLPDRPILAGAMACVMFIAAAAEIVHLNKAALLAAIHNADFHNDPQWRLAAALTGYGLHAGDRVAVIRGIGAAPRVHWAYVSGLRIVAEFGSEPWRIEPENRIDGDPPEPGYVDYARVFWTQLTQDQRAKILDAFRSAGARAVVSETRPEGPLEPGWTALSGTEAAIYDFEPR